MNPRRFLLMIITIAIAAAHVRAETFGDISVSNDTPFAGQYQHGYTEVRFSIVNRSPDREHIVGLELNGGGYGNVDHVRQMTRTVRISPGTASSVSLFMPPLASSHGGAAAIVTIDGRRQRGGVGYNAGPYQGNRGYWGGTSTRIVLVSRGVGGTFRDGVVRHLNSGTTGHGANVEIMDGPDTASWGTSWLSYSSFDGVVITADELRRAPEQVRNALWRYCETGGVLTVFGEIDVPRPWEASQQHHADVRRHHVGFGILLVVPRGRIALDKWDQATWQGMDTHWQQTARPLNESSDLASANSRFPVVDNLTLPVRSMLALMIVFAIVIGPVNLVVLTRKRKAIWMLWTVPALAVVTSACVFAYATVVEGWNAHSRIAAVTLLDEVNQRATTLGWIGYYAPLTPGDGLRFDADTELLPQLSTGGNQGGTARTIDWTSGQHLQSGWVSARVPAFFKVRKSERRLERLQVTPGDDGTITAVNGLGAPIAGLIVADAQGVMHRGDAIDAGASAVLTPAVGKAMGASLRSAVFNDSWHKPINAEPKDHSGFTVLGPGMYLAVIDAAPFIEPGLAYVKSSKQRSVVIGILKDPVP